MPPVDPCNVSSSKLNLFNKVGCVCVADYIVIVLCLSLREINNPTFAISLVMLA